MIVPNHDLIQRILRRIAASDQRKDIAPEKHLDGANSPAVPIEIAAEDLAEGITVKNTEAAVSAGGEAAVVLVEGDVEELDWVRVGVGVGVRVENGRIIVGGGMSILFGSGIVGGSSVVGRRVRLQALLLLLEVGLEHGGDQIGIRARVWMRGEAGDGGHGGDRGGITGKEEWIEFASGRRRIEAMREEVKDDCNATTPIQLRN